MSIQGTGRKAILEFDLSDANPNFEYQYTLQLYITFVAQNEQRSVTASYVTQPGFSWDESRVTYNNFGTPETQHIGWFSIFQEDSESLVEIPLGNLYNSTFGNGGRVTLLLENESTQNGGDKIDFRSREFGNAFPGVMVDKPPTLIGVPVKDE